ncbi:MAG: EAL domain-containing protein [Gammaproteobacteria bacterium]|nr:EAL domain-containing protein [Gammaproteobacteria bacterium]
MKLQTKLALKHLRLRSKLLLLLIPIIILPLSGLSYIAVNQLNTLTENNATREFDRLLEQYQAEFNTLINTAVSNIQLFSQSNELKNYMQVEDEGERYWLLQASLMRLFSSYQKAFPNYYEIRILLPDGFEDTRVINNKHLHNVTENEKNTDLFHMIHHQIPNTPSLHFQTNPDDNKLILHVGLDIRLVNSDQDPITAKKKLRGYMILTVNLEEFFLRLSKQKIGQQGYFFVIDNQGIIKYHPDAMQVGKKISSFQLLWDSANAIKTSLLGIPSYIRGFKQNNQLMIIASMPTQELHTDSNKLSQAVFIIATVSVLAIMIVTFLLFNRFFLVPINKLQNKMRIFAQNKELDDPPLHFSRDELGELERDFCHMAEQLRESHLKIEFQAYHDHLTGVINRVQLINIINQKLAAQTIQPFALLLIDIDGFKTINDIMGHRAGDDLLIVIAQRIRNLVDSFGNVNGINKVSLARLGGDEFMVILNSFDQQYDIEQIAQSILAQFTQSFIVKRQNIYVGASIGVASYPAHGSNTEELMHNADLAKLTAKSTGKNQVVFYNTNLEDTARERAVLEHLLHNAMDSSTELFMTYQPKMQLSNKNINSVESLIRWKQPEKGFIGPDIFIPCAEENGQIIKLGEWILRTICRQACNWQQHLNYKIKIAVNISAQQLIQQNFLNMVSTILKQENCPSELIEFEITETSMLNHDEKIRNILNKIKELGIAISLDDFGTGYSSLSHLRQFPIDTIKIDRSFIQEATENNDDRSIVTAIVSMSHKLGLDVIAEGVETEQQLHFLEQIGCDFIQGYYLSRPVSADELEHFINQQ